MTHPCPSMSPIVASPPTRVLLPSDCSRRSPFLTTHGVVIISADPEERSRLMAAVNRIPRLRLVSSHACADGLATHARRPDDTTAVDLVLYELCEGIDPSRLRRGVAMLRAHLPGTRVVALVSADEPQRMHQAILAGMDGCIFRPTQLDRLTRLLLEIAQGAPPICSSVAEQLMATVRQARRTSTLCPTGVTPGQLTRRQRDVLRLLARGLAYKEVADVLDIGLDTVRSHIRRLYKKLGIHTAAEAAVWAVRNGMTEDRDTP